MNSRLRRLRARAKPKIEDVNFLTLLESLENAMVSYNEALLTIDNDKFKKAEL